MDYTYDYTGNLVWVHQGLGFAGNRMPVSINAIYALSRLTHRA